MLRRIMKKPKLASLLALVPQSKVRKPMNKLQAHANRLTHSAYDDYEEPTTKLSTAFVVVLALHVVAVAGIYAFHSIKAKRREADGTAVAAKTVAPASNVVAASARPPVPQKTATVPASAAPVAPVLPPVAPSANGAQKTSGTGTGATAKTENAASHLPAPSGPSAVIPAQKTPAQTAQAAPSQTVPSRTPAGNPSGTSVAAKAQPPAVTPIKAVAVVPAVQPVAAVDSAPKTYTVVKGDNPVAIAKRMNVNYEEMLKLNKIDDPKKLQIGQTLKMPAAKQSH